MRMVLSILVVLLVVSCNVMADPPGSKWTYVTTSVGDEKFYIDDVTRDGDIYSFRRGRSVRGETFINYIGTMKIDVKYNSYQLFIPDGEWTEIRPRSIYTSYVIYLQTHYPK